MLNRTCFLLLFCVLVWELPSLAKDLPNFVIFNLDDSGYSDFSPFGNTAYSTPHVQKLADEGCRLTNFHTPQAVCSASRAALLTGCAMKIIE